MGKICFYVDCPVPHNVQRLLSNLGRMVPESENQLVAMGSRTLNREFHRFFDIYQYQDSGMIGSARKLSDHSDENDLQALIQLTRPPMHGTIVGGVARRHGIPFVYRYSGDRFYEYLVAQGTTKLTAFTLGELLGRVPLYLGNQYIALGPNGRDRLIARGVDYDDVTLLPPAVDPGPFEEASPVPLDVPDEREIALFVGRLSHLKGIGTLERTIPRVLNRRDDIQFVFVGDDERRPDLPKHFENHLTIVGRVPPEEIPGYMKAADILIHPSLTDGIPRVVMEALAAGTPVLARNVGDVASVTGNIFETDDEFVELLSAFEDLPLNDISPFTVEALAPRYRAFFEQFQ